MKGLIASTNLSALADALRGKRPYRALVGMADKAEAIATVKEDLVEAGRCLATLTPLVGDVSPAGHSRDRTTIIGALFDKAIITYARATAQGGNNRMSILHEDRLDPKLRNQHQRILALRNACVAHFGPGESMDGRPLVRTAVTWSEYRYHGRSVHALAGMANRAQHRDDIAEALASLIETQLERLKPIWVEVQLNIHHEMNRLRHEDADFAALVAGFPFDPNEIVEDEDVAVQLALGIERADLAGADYSVIRRKS